MASLNLTKLGLSQNIIENSGRNIEMSGKLRGDKNEVIVIMYKGHTLTKAHVCHLSLGYPTRNSTEMCNLILDIPNFTKVIIPPEMMEIVVKEYKGAKYTMVPESEKNLVSSYATWFD